MTGDRFFDAVTDEVIRQDRAHTEAVQVVAILYRMMRSCDAV